MALQRAVNLRALLTYSQEIVLKAEADEMLYNTLQMVRLENATPSISTSNSGRQTSATA